MGYALSCAHLVDVTILTEFPVFYGHLNTPRSSSFLDSGLRRTWLSTSRLRAASATAAYAPDPKLPVARIPIPRLSAPRVRTSGI